MPKYGAALLLDQVEQCIDVAKRISADAIADNADTPALLAAQSIAVAVDKLCEVVKQLAEREGLLL